jgi:hypothetical protein
LIVLLDLDLLDATEIHPESLSAATSEHTSITLSQCGTGTVSLAVLSDTSTVAQYDLTADLLQMGIGTVFYVQYITSGGGGNLLSNPD